jgi:hypothetical protein
VATDETNPFLITPPPGLLPAAAADPDPETPTVDDPEDFITLPPGIADSATHRVATPRQVPPRAAPAADEIVFFPVVPGVPAIAPEPTSAAALEAPPTAPSVLPNVVSEVDAFSGETRVVPPRHTATAGWTVQLPNGQLVGIDSAIVIGRDPAAQPRYPGAVLVPALDPAKSLSKTHALLEVEGGTLWVHDLDSTNGVFVAAPGIDVVQVDPGIRVVVPEGADVELGEFIITATRA